MTEIIRFGNENFSSDGYQNSQTTEAKIAKDVAREYIFLKVGRPLKNSPRRETEIIVRLSEEIERKHDMLLKSMCNRLNINSENAYKTFCEIAEEIFKDDINWGRIVVLYTFAGKLAIHCMNNKMDNMIDKVILWLGNFIARKQIWIKEKGNGWTGFIETFRDAKSDNEKMWYQGLVATTLGLGTLAAAFYIHS
ncbi:apoptosis regulator Bcl-2-like [Rhopilema esculentum]|uniref:apoptosis regulator Bcl-2-like n=1 Tax=Rhopilema esculentum TaxID=499914 RepID=UPI0031E2D26A|eukprot:gene6198-11602_t